MLFSTIFEWTLFQQNKKHFRVGKPHYGAMINFFVDEETGSMLLEIARTLGMEHIDLSRVVAIRSQGSKAKKTIARCYGLPKVWQNALGLEAHYIIEIISENFDRLSGEEKEKTLIHELMHIPRSFGGGFRHHNPHVNARTVEAMYSRYRKAKGALPSSI